MGSNRITVRLDQLGEIVGGATPSTKNPKYWGGNIPWLSPKDLTGYKYRHISRGEKNITEDGLNSCSTKMLPKGSVLFSSRAPIGYCAIAANPVCTNQGFKSIVPKEGINSEFLYYLLCSNRDSIAGTGSGTTFPEVSGKTMRQFEVTIPACRDEQKVIARVLGTLDEKIELNNLINGYLAELLDAKFGKLLEDVDGWSEASLLDIANYKNGLAMQKFRPKAGDSGLPVLKIRELGQGCCGSDSERCQSDIDEAVLVHDGDLIFSWSGTLLLDFWAGEDAGLNQHLFKVTSAAYPSWFYYMWTKYHLRKFIAMAKDRATTMGHIKRSALADSKVLIPEQSVLDELTKTMQPIVDRMILNKVENRQLSNLRNALLPKLMSGEIDITKLDITNQNMECAQ